jgi:hypothetical protein
MNQQEQTFCETVLRSNLINGKLHETWVIFRLGGRIFVDVFERVPAAARVLWQWRAGQYEREFLKI